MNSVVFRAQRLLSVSDTARGYVSNADIPKCLHLRSSKTLKNEALRIIDAWCRAGKLIHRKVTAKFTVRDRKRLIGSQIDSSGGEPWRLLPAENF